VLVKIIPADELACMHKKKKDKESEKRYQ